MFPTPVGVLVKQTGQRFSELGAVYVLLYVDTVDARGRLDIRMSSNYQDEQIGPLLGSLLEPGEKVKQMLADLFKTRPLRVQVESMGSEGAPAQGEDPVFVDVPTDQAVEMVLAALMPNLQLKQAKPKSSIIVPE